MVSAAGTMANLRQAIDGGADAFVVKPYKGIKIQEALAKFHARRAGGLALRAGVPARLAAAPHLLHIHRSQPPAVGAACGVEERPWSA